MGSSLPPGKQNFFLGFLWMILPKQYGFVFIYHPGQTKFGDVTFNIFHYDITVYAFAVFRFNFKR